MNRQEKDLVISNLRQSFQDSNAAFLVQYQGLSVEDLQALRKGLKQSEGALRVAKARLMKRAAEGLPGAQDMIPEFKNQVALIFARGESPAVAKVLYDFAKDHEKLKLIAGTMEEQLLDENSIKVLASLPPRDMLLAQLCGTLQAPISNLARLGNLMIIRLLVVMKQIAEKGDQ
jgi:large subunit ribosomal protein L10